MRHRNYEHKFDRKICEVENKFCYSSKSEARKASRLIKDIAVYKCKHCYYWHVTTKRNKFFNGNFSKKFRELFKK